jgi:hypothetical protein
MKNIFLLVGALVLLVTVGFGQTPAPSSNTGQATIKGCLGGSDGDYTVAQDGTNRIFKITTSTVDLNPHLGRHVEVIGQEAYVAAGSGFSDNSVVVTALNVISEHCATATARARSTSVGTSVASGIAPAAAAARASPTTIPATTPANSPPAAATQPASIGCANCSSPPTPRGVILTPGARATSSPVQMPEETSKIEAAIASAALTLALIIIWRKRNWHQGRG